MEPIRNRKLGTGAIIAAFVAGSLAGGVLTGIALADQPHMQSAIKHLEGAKEELQKAEADKGWHRERAIDSIQKAIDETKSGIDYAREHRKR